MTGPTLRDRLAQVRERIEAARARRGGGDPVTLVAITKTYPAVAVVEAIEAGIGDVGENRVAELEAKVSEVGRDRVRWHLVGHLQRNKARRAIPDFDLLHSLDSLRLARQLSEDAVRLGRDVDALVQVNTSGEASKYGLAADEAMEAVRSMARLPRLRLLGLMTMAPLTADERVLRATFSRARELSERLAGEVEAYQPRHLSMGMSNDYEIAIEEGSNLVRLGTVLFGERER